MSLPPIISITTFLFASIGIIAILMVRDDERGHKSMKQIALWITFINFLFSLILLFFLEPGGGFQYIEEYNWLSDVISYRVGIDGISVYFVILTTFLMFICILASWNSIKFRIREFLVSFLLLEISMIGVFVSLDLVLFYIFFEVGLIPMYLIIGIWGGKDRIYASYKFFLYTLAGSVLMLVAMLSIYSITGSTDITYLLTYKFSPEVQTWLWLAFFASFAVKIPMWPFHTWLPDAHVQAPTSGSVILAGVLLKMGGYGFIRFSLPMFPDASQFFGVFIYSLSVIGVLYASMLAFVQTDIKKLIAYSSVAHMGFVTLGLFSGTLQGVQGAMFLMLSHGLISGALFLCIGFIYDRLHTREITAFGGLASQMPKYAVLLIIFTMANMGLPGTSGFVGEFLVLVGVLSKSIIFAGIAALGVILSAAYGLRFYRYICFGKLDKPNLLSLKDLYNNELICLSSLAFFVIFFGIYPSTITDITHHAVINTIPYLLDAGSLVSR